MIFDQRISVPAPMAEVWEFMVDVPRMSACMPGLQDVTEVGADAYAGALQVTVGPISVRLEGRLRLEQDRDTWTMRLVVEAVDRRIRSSLNASTTMRLVPGAERETEIVMHTETAVLGKLGQLGQAVLRKKSDQMLGQFGENVASALRGEPAPSPAPAAAHEPPG